MKQYPRILNKVYREPWLIRPAQHQAIQAALEAHLESRADVGNIELPQTTEPAVTDGVAVVPVFGILGKHLSGLEMLCGGADVDAIREDIAVALEDDAVNSILLHVSSPGGTVTGIPELADYIARAATVKPVVAFTDCEACSAAYWLASQATRFYATPSASVGSVGVYMALIDETERMAAEGVKVNAIYSGQWKLAGASFKPLSEAERDRFQRDVEAIHEDFKQAVSAHRQIGLTYLEGQDFDGATAARLNLTDGTVNSIDELLALLTTQTG